MHPLTSWLVITVLSSAAMDESARTADRRQVLIVDDEPLLRIGLADVRGRRLNVFEPSDAAEALAVLKAESGIRIFVTHIQMPGS